MTYQYQTSAYGQPWATVRESPTFDGLNHVMTGLWLQMLPEKHHRIFNVLERRVVWEHRSKIAPAPGTLQ